MEKKSAPGLVVPTAVEDDLDGTNKRKKGEQMPGESNRKGEVLGFNHFFSEGQESCFLETHRVLAVNHSRLFLKVGV